VILAATTLATASLNKLNSTKTIRTPAITTPTQPVPIRTPPTLLTAAVAVATALRVPDVNSSHMASALHRINGELRSMHPSLKTVHTFLTDVCMQHIYHR